MDWEAPPKPAEVAESRLIDAILDGRFPSHSALPAERELSHLVGVTRPTLREALQRLARDGWVEIRHGKPTRVRDYWREGSLGVLGAIAQRQEKLPFDFISNLLAVRTLLAPAYTRLAVECSPSQVCDLLRDYPNMEEVPEVFASADLELHCQLSIVSRNPIFTLILNGFRDLYESMARIYFSIPAARAHSRRFYADLLRACQKADPHLAEAITLRVMQESLDFWLAASKSSGGDR
jgi:GntR family negative regulator for fad regulon and positive regulator of fabA